jgi:myo-inositol-1(or 4)-monophosphatase
MVSSTDPQELLHLARTIAVEAGTMATTMRTAGISVATTKSNQLDIVTQADTAVENLIKDRLKAARPDDGFLGEEGGEVEGSSGITWIVDPIDGTVNYLYGSSYYAVSIAATMRGDDGGRVSIAACVYAPALSAEYSAAVGHPAYLNGTELHVNTSVPLDKALVSTGFLYDIATRPTVLQDVTTLATKIRDVRMIGAAALEICGVAEGRTDAHFQRGLPIWDYAAAILIAQQAGAEVRGIDATVDRVERLLIANPKLAATLDPLLA